MELSTESGKIDLGKADLHLLALLSSCRALKTLINHLSDTAITEEIRFIANTQEEIIETYIPGTLYGYQNHHYGSKKLYEFLTTCCDIAEPKWSEDLENIDEKKI